MQFMESIDQDSIVDFTLKLHSKNYSCNFFRISIIIICKRKALWLTMPYSQRKYYIKWKLHLVIIHIFSFKLKEINNMKVYPNGLIILDATDIICLGVILGYSTTTIVKLLKTYYSNKNEDPLVSDLKRLSPVKEKEKNKPLKVPIRYFPRGGQLPPGLKRISVFIKNKQLGKLVVILLRVTKKIRELKRVKSALILLNVLLFRKLGLAFAAGGSITHIHILLFVTTSSTAGALLALLSAAGGFIFVLAPLLTLISRYEFISSETVNRCRLLCEAAQEYHNKKLGIEMKSFAQEMETSLSLTSDEGPLQCTGEGKLYQRYKEGQEYLNNQVNNFNKIKNRFSECNDETADEINEKIQKISQKVRTEF